MKNPKLITTIIKYVKLPQVWHNVDFMLDKMKMTTLNRAALLLVTACVSFGFSSHREELADSSEV